MEALSILGSFFIGVGLLLASVAFLWWVSIYDKIHSDK